jgi:uridine phosphorylase
MRRLFTLLVCFFIGANLMAVTKSIGDPSDTNFPKDSEGRVYHLGLKKGEIANRVVLVGDPDRAKLVAALLDYPDRTFTHASNRGFTTYTGTYQGIPVSIMAMGMGASMMDFAVREIRAITDGPLFLIRLGSCGTPSNDVAIGTVVVAKESFNVTTNCDAYHQVDPKTDRPIATDYFTISSTIEPDLTLHHKLTVALQKQSNNSFPVVEAVDATADSFYGSQGRIDSNFADQNTGLIEAIMDTYPETASLQMETYYLFHLANLNKYTDPQEGSIAAAACAIVLAQRKSGGFLTNDRKHEIELEAGSACLEALIQK